MDASVLNGAMVKTGQSSRVERKARVAGSVLRDAG